MNKQLLIYYFIISFSFLFANNPNKIASISYIEGTCKVENVELNRSISPLMGNSIFNHDIIYSDANSYCDIMFDDSATMIHLDPNTKVKLVSEKYSRVIKIYNGSAFVNSAKTKFKTYVQTDKNDIYVNNNSVWVGLYDDYDKIVAINNASDVYNYSESFKIDINPLIVYNISSKGQMRLDENLDLIPEYAKNETYLQVKKNNNSKTDIFLNEYDLIPIYGEIDNSKISNNNGFSFTFLTGLRHMNDKEYFSVELHPKFRYNNLYIKAKLNVYYGIEDSELYNNYNSLNSIMEKFHLWYKYSDYYNSVEVYAGEIPKTTFGHGYLVKNLSNSYEYPKLNDFGIRVDFKLDNDFMNFKFIVPSIREYMRQGGIFGMHTSLFISHKFPLTLGLGIIIDLNQLNQASRIYNISKYGNRKISALELDFNLDIIKKMNLDVSLFGEFVGMWYQNDIYYIQSEGVLPYYDDIRWRKGTWGIMAPGIAMKFNNRYEVKFAFNFNSAAFYPSYFNTNYLYNKGVYFKSDAPLGFNSLGFNLVSEQIDLLNEFSINDSNTEFLVPKEIYPILTNRINAFPVYGFTTELNFNFRNKVKYYSLLGIYTQKTEVVKAETFYTLDSSISIEKNILKNVSNIEFYISNIFFLESGDKETFTFGANLLFDLRSGMSLKLDFAQVYYDANLDGDKEGIINIGIDYGVGF